jgi:acyl-CoA synthetase (AMP-forming)/AMP-acid ligase II
VHFDAAILTRIFGRLAINVVATDTEERLLRLSEVRSRTTRPFRIYSTGTPNADAQGVRDTESLADACARIDLERAGAWLEGRKNRPITDVATVMFTSGSTGAPKGIAFTLYHLVTKRFARAAALPDVGGDTEPRNSRRSTRPKSTGFQPGMSSRNIPGATSRSSAGLRTSTRTIGDKPSRREESNRNSRVCPAARSLGG